MSYILDALKKSDQERHQGTTPNLHSIHGSPLSVNKSSTFQQHRSIWLISGGIILFLCCLGIFFLLYQQHLAVSKLIKENDPPLLSAESQKRQTTTSPQPANQVGKGSEISSPQIIIKERQHVLRSIAVENPPPYPQAGFATDTSKPSLPLLIDLPAQLQAEVPNLQFAGHTYSEEASQRMIIINGRILREGDMIAPNTYLTEITWEGVTIAYRGTRFRVKTD